MGSMRRNIKPEECTESPGDPMLIQPILGDSGTTRQHMSTKYQRAGYKGV